VRFRTSGPATRVHCSCVAFLILRGALRGPYLVAVGGRQSDGHAGAMRWNTRVFPGVDPLVVRRGGRVRMGNLSMTNHPIHKRGEPFEVTCTDGGWIPLGARRLEVTTDVPVGAMRVRRAR
jgi:FtsP/CotA-like multicopper oxidase with cupredoxin domain